MVHVGSGFEPPQDPCFVLWNPDVSNQPRETKIGLTNRVVREIRGKISVRLRGGNEFWFELLGYSKNRGSRNRDSTL